MDQHTARTEVFTCGLCKTDVTRPVVRGQRPKWCADCRRSSRKKTVTCGWCGKVAPSYGGLYCTVQCSNAAKPPPPPKPRVKPAPKVPKDNRSLLRKAYDEGDSVAFFVHLANKVDKVDGCWLWKGRSSGGYPVFRASGKDCPLHRLVLEVKHGVPLGSQHAHHACANTLCVNPDHLQPVTHRENIAEMLARRTYLHRIRELEDALALLDPSHPVLQVIPVC